jgi:aminoglycoside phosphotransferase
VRLTPAQSALVQAWLPDARLQEDLSWGLTDTAVLDVAAGTGRYVIKAAGPGNSHIGREITAHLTVTAALAAGGDAARMIHFDRGENLLVTEYLQGELVQGTSAETAPDAHRQAGALLRRLHEQSARIDDESEARATRRALAWLDGVHRIETSVAAQLRGILTAYKPGPVTVVPTHGDWHPRNWLIDNGRVKAIDFGRFDQRPAISDFCRLSAQQWRGRPDLKAAFFDGYGHAVAHSGLWPIFQMREAIGTAAWAHKVGDVPFEEQGHRMIADALALVASGVTCGAER